jgi:hypothetical protein
MRDTSLARNLAASVRFDNIPREFVVISIGGRLATNYFLRFLIAGCHRMRSLIHRLGERMSQLSRLEDS